MPEVEDRLRPTRPFAFARMLGLARIEDASRHDRLHLEHLTKP